MARIKYRPSSKTKGFNPTQLSQQGITEMRRNSDRVIQGMRSNLQAEKEQQETDRAALKESERFDEDRIRRDREIDLENLKNKKISMDQQAEVDAQQAQYDLKAQNTFLETFVGLSKTVGDTIIKNHEEWIKKETEKGQTSDISGRVKEVLSSIESLGPAAIVNADNIIEEDINNGATELTTVKGLVSEPAVSFHQKRAEDIRVFDTVMQTQMQKALTSDELLYVDSHGDKFSGQHSINNSEQAYIVGQAVKKDTLKRLGLDTAEPGYLDEGIKKADDMIDAYTKRAYNTGLNDIRVVAKQKAKDLINSGDPTSIALGWNTYKNTQSDGRGGAWNMLIQAAENPNNKVEPIVRAMATADGKKYKDEDGNIIYDPIKEGHPRHKKFKAAITKRNDTIDEGNKALRTFQKESVRTQAAAALPDILASAAVDLKATQALVTKTFADVNEPVPSYISSAIAAVGVETENEERARLEFIKRNGNLDDVAINSFKSRKIRKEAAEAKAENEERIWGKKDQGIRDGYEEDAQQLVKDTTGDPTTMAFLVASTMRKQHRILRDKLGSPEAAYEANKKLWNDALTERDLPNADKQNPYYQKTGDNNTIVFPGIEKIGFDPNKFREENEYMLVKHGADVSKAPHIVMSEEELEITLRSARETGMPIFPAQLRRNVDALNENITDPADKITYTAYFNEVQLAKSALDGVNHPTLTESLSTHIIDAMPPEVAKLISWSDEFKSHHQRKRAAAGVQEHYQPNSLSNYTRRSMPGGVNPTPREVFDYLRSKGVSDTHARGIVANNVGEAEMTPDGRIITASLGDGGMSGGIFQMYDTRKRKMEQAVPDWRTNWRGQIDHALQDDVAPQYLQMQFPDGVAAADWFMEKFERPAEEHRPGRREHNRSFLQNLGF